MFFWFSISSPLSSSGFVPVPLLTHLPLQDQLFRKRENKVSFVLAWPWSDEKHEDDQQYKWKEEPDEGAQPQHGVHRQWQHSRARRRPPAIDSMNTKMEESDDYWNINSNFVIATIVIAMLNIIAILGCRPTSLLNCGIPRACSTSPLFLFY